MQIKNILFINSIFSLISAIWMFFFNDYLQKIFGFELWYVFPLIGFGLLNFVRFIWYVIKYRLNNTKFIQSIIIMDFMWVIISIAIVLLNPFWISLAWLCAILIVAIIVGIIWLLQLKAIAKKIVIKK